MGQREFDQEYGPVWARGLSCFSSHASRYRSGGGLYSTGSLCACPASGTPRPRSRWRSPLGRRPCSCPMHPPATPSLRRIACAVSPSRASAHGVISKGCAGGTTAESVRVAKAGFPACVGMAQGLVRPRKQGMPLHRTLLPRPPRAARCRRCVRWRARVPCRAPWIPVFTGMTRGRRE